MDRPAVTPLPYHRGGEASLSGQVENRAGTPKVLAHGCTRGPGSRQAVKLCAVTDYQSPSGGAQANDGSPSTACPLELDYLICNFSLYL